MMEVPELPRIKTVEYMRGIALEVAEAHAVMVAEAAAAAMPLPDAATTRKAGLPRWPAGS